MKKRYVSSVLLVCTFVCFLSTLSYAQIKPTKDRPGLPDGPITNIVGGSVVNISLVPWQILLEVNGIDNCGGTIIAPNWILTAAHCVNGRTANQLKVYAGITLRSQKNTGQIRSVTQIIIHPGFNAATNDNDIALLSSTLAL